MKIIEEHHKEERVVCEDCGSVFELETDSEKWDWYSHTMKCPVCGGHKTRNI